MITIDTNYITYIWLSNQFKEFTNIINYQDDSDFSKNKKGGSKKKWTSFVHNGILFPPEYIKHNVPIIYENEEIILTESAEECATLYSKYIDSEYIKNKIFNKNFWSDWKKVLGKDHKIKELEKCDFKLIYEHLLKEKERKNNLTKEEKEQLKIEKDQLEEKYKTASVDGKQQPVGNFRMEPPGIFIGRGCHPKLGKIKMRTYPEDVTLNISKDAPIPETLTNHKWGKIIHDKNVEWLASWKENISGKTKYVWLGAHSDFKAESDKQKFEMARKLKKKIKTIREENDKNLLSDKLHVKQTATALYFIDNLALRVGNEKGDDEADTVGVSSLRVEHVFLLENNKIKLDFLGKDSVNYVNTIQVTDNIYNNIKQFTEGKNKDDQLFDKITSSDINKYLQDFMKDLTAKVFRTFNASNLFQKELKKINKKYDGYEETDKINLLLDEFNKANAKVAMLCNHQKNISKSFTDQLDKINSKIKKLKTKLKKLKDDKKKNEEKIKKVESDINQAKLKKELKVEMKNISLGTSKVNYIDPRITVSFMKKHNLPVDKIFSKTLQDKFKWAFEIDSEYKF